MKTNEQISRDWQNIDNSGLETICNILRKREYNVQDYLANIVAALCDVNIDEMFSNTNVSRLTHARWLFWYAYRYKTAFSYEAIAKNTERYGHPYDLRTIQNAVNKMSSMIDASNEWSHRWEVIKRIIKLSQTAPRADEEELKDATIVISIPKELKNKLNIVVKEK